MAASTRALLSVTAALALTGHPTTAGNRLAARHDAARLLRLFVLPPGARPLRSEPGGAGGLLSRAQSVPGTAALVDAHRFWRVHAPLDSVVAFERRHRPPGSTLDGFGSAGGPHYPPNRGLQFGFRPLAGRISSRQLEVEIVALRDGWTGIRADAQDVWLVARPPAEVVPPGVREIDVRRSHGGSRSVPDARSVARIIRWFDALPVVQPIILYCPAFLGLPTVTFEFRDASGALVARARTPGSAACGGSIGFSIRDRAQTPLLVDDFLVRAGRLLGMRLAPRYR